MAASPSVVALPWYARGDYPALLQLFSDSDLLPATYDGWLKRAQVVERQFQKAGFGVAKIRIRPAQLAEILRNEARNARAGMRAGEPSETTYGSAPNLEALPGAERIYLN